MQNKFVIIIWEMVTNDKLTRMGSLALVTIMLVFGCHRNPTKPHNDNVPWTRIESFGTQPIFALSVSSDSTELRVISTDKFGYLLKGQLSDAFAITPLADSIHFVNTAHITDYIPYFTDDKCFMGNADGTKIYIYNVIDGAWNKIGELNIGDFLTDTPEYKERFGRSHWVNLSNHITWAGGSQYYITTEQRRQTEEALYATIYKHFLISLSETEPSNFKQIYQTTGFNVEVESEIFSSCFIGEHFLQDIYVNNCHVILSKDSPQYIQGSGNYPIRDRFIYGECLYGMADGIVMKSDDLGINWVDLANINGPWSYTLINGKHILFLYNNIAHWKLEESYESTKMLESNALMGYRIHYLKEFNGYVYAATNNGLFKKPVSAFFSPKTESKNSDNLVIKRR